MKISINHLNRSAGISLLDWPADISSGSGKAGLSRAKFWKQATIPHLRIVSNVANDGLFSYATAAKSGTEFWETIVYAAMGVSAAGALVVAFGI